MKRILVIGNGFDIDAKLRTSYKEFINLCMFLKEAYKNGEQGMSEYINAYRNNNKRVNKKNPRFEKSTLRALSRYFIVDHNSEKVIFEERKQLLEICNQNFLLDFVIENRDSFGDRWADFEYIISQFINVLSLYKEDIMSLKDCQPSTSEECFLEKQALKKFIRDGIADNRFKKNHLLFEALKKELVQELARLTWILEIYLCRFLNNKRKKNDLISAIQADYVLSFNYTDTYQKLYNKDIDIHFIHGRIQKDSSIRKNTMVFGIERDIKNVDDEDCTFLDFQKYYQRIVKKTGNMYKHWLHQDICVFFFGHSLDYNDGDVIKNLIANKKARSVIFYYDDEAFKMLVRNLIRIFGKDTIINYTENERIVFLQTKDSEGLSNYLDTLTTPATMATKTNHVMNRDINTAVK